MNKSQTGYLSYPDGTWCPAAPIPKSSEVIHLYDQPTTSDLLGVYALAWPSNLIAVAFGSFHPSIVQTFIREVKSSDKTILIKTSGTAGEPKISVIPMERMRRPNASSSELTGENIWGHFFDNTRIAAHNVVAHVIATNGTIASRENGLSYDELVSFYRKVGVNCISLTPSLARRLITSRAMSDWKLKQITLGGEIADQYLLDRLGRLFPNARVTHVYASTENGSLFSVSDGLAGFPASMLGKNVGVGKVLTISEGALALYDPILEKIDVTDDLVALDASASRVFFRGRRGSIINVGGRKVSLQHIKQVILEDKGVLDCEVFGLDDKFLGNLVGARIWLKNSSELAKTEIQRFLSAKLEKWERPIKIVWVDSIELNSNGKARQN